MLAPGCLSLENVSRRFGGLKAVDEVNLSIGHGERHAIIGPNGAGKTTLFNLVSGELACTGGRVVFLGEDVTALKPHQRAARGMARTFQITRLFPNLTVLENVLLACEALDPRRLSMHRPLSSYRDFQRKALALLERFGLSPLREALARNIAYGDQRKLEVALSMTGQPTLLLLDEPMAGLSPAERQSMQRLLHDLDPAIAVLLIEHDMDMAFGFAERVAVLFQGRVLAQGGRDEIRGNEDVQAAYLGAGATIRGAGRLETDRAP
jgi:branched-chain amino acid transport system ATP-binding protein